MSTLESIIWHTLGYISIPLIVVAGILISSLAFYFLLKIFKVGGDD